MVLSWYNIIDKVNVNLLSIQKPFLLKYVFDSNFKYVFDSNFMSKYLKNT